jgi:aryl-alcohol dehydrogenase-like predicted oxidoreductase
MRIPVKKLRNGFAMPVYGLGTWQMGGGSIPDPDNDDAADIGAIRAAIDAGVTHIDTAESYADGLF